MCSGRTRVGSDMPTLHTKNHSYQYNHTLNNNLFCIKLKQCQFTIIDLKKGQSYTHLQVDRPHIALNSKTYISLRHQQLKTCKNIGFEFYCEEFFVVKHKSKYTCETAIYFNLGSEVIKEICNFAYYFSKTDI